MVCFMFINILEVQDFFINISEVHSLRFVGCGECFAVLVCSCNTDHIIFCWLSMDFCFLYGFFKLTEGFCGQNIVQLLVLD